MGNPNSRMQQQQPLASNAKNQQQQAVTMSSGQDLNYYPIRLLPEQSVYLFGFLEAKTTLTWRDVIIWQSINLNSCVSCGIDTLKLYRMQPDIKEWIKCGKASLSDCRYMNQWKPNPFTDLRCSIGDLVLHRHSLHPKMLIDCGITFTILKERYGITKDIMIMLRYSVDEWIDLEIDQEFLKELSNDQWAQLFGEASRSDIIESSKRKASLKN